MANRLNRISTFRKPTPKIAPPPAYDWAKTEQAGKGEKDGRCNRTACQAPLAGQPQWFMEGSYTSGPRLYYCERCADDFNSWDRSQRLPERCARETAEV